MRLKVPKTERRNSADSTGRRIIRRVVIVSVAIVLLGLAGSHLLSLVTANSNPDLSAVLAGPEDAAASAITPLQSGFSSVVDSVVNYLYRLKLRSTLELEYNKLKQENEQLVYQAMLAAELREKLSTYETLFKEVSVNESMNPLVATVIGREAGNYFSVFTINKGGNEGIRDFMAVTMGGALVGYTYNVSPTKSDVRTIIDSQASIAGLISSTRDQGTVRGTLGIDGQAMCRMYYLPEDLLPRPGDSVATSGVGMSFPKGIPIGIVRESTRGMESNKQYIVVEPQADFEHIEYVIVLRYQPEAEAVEVRIGDDQDMIFTPLDTQLPIPTIKIGNEFYNLAPTPTPSITTATSVSPGASMPSMTPSPRPTGGGVEYQIPIGNQTNNSYGYTLVPTASPSPTPEPVDLTVEED